MQSRKSPIANRKSQIGFTLIELLVVIAIIAAIAAMLIPVGGAIIKKSILQRAMSERDQIETAIQSYYSKYGFYPPSNGVPGNWLTNQLYYELVGTTAGVSGSVTNFTTLDNADMVDGTAVQNMFNVSGFMNCTRGSGDDAVQAQTFLSRLKSSQIAGRTNVEGEVVDFLVTAANSDPIYQPLPNVYSQAGHPANPWRYMYPGTNNPSSYDLYVQVYIGGKTNLICNWAKQPQINVPLP